jgi:chromosome segregation ATPase
MRPDASAASGGIRIDLGTLLTVIGAAVIIIALYLFIKKITSIPGDMGKKLRGLFGRRSALETLQKQVLQLQEENDKLTLANMQARQELDKLRRAKYEVDEALSTAKSKLQALESDMEQTAAENSRLIEYCKDLRHRIDIGERQARKESLETAFGLVRLGVDKSISLLQSSVTGSWDRIQTQVVKLNAVIAEEIRKLPSPKGSEKERDDFDPYKDDWQ